MTGAADVEAPVQEVNRAWAEQNWPGGIGLASQVPAVTPEYEGVRIKLYTAHLNYGYQLIGEEKYPEDIIYLVRWGDTLTIIARRFNTTIQAIMEANRLTNDRIYADQELRIPQ